MTAGTDDICDVLLTGPVFFDLVLSGLDGPPAPGTEVYAEAMDASPGGIANLAVATARLGLRTALASTLGDDVYGRWCRDFLADQEGIDLARTRMLPQWPTPVTVSIAADGDRSMVTREERSPLGAGELVGATAAARTAIADLAQLARDGDDPWWRRAAADGTRIFADVGWDPTGAWDPSVLAPLASCHAFMPNEREAMAYTRTDSAAAAARALAAHVPLVVVTRGADGAIAIDSARGEEVHVPAVAADVRDATGAGDVFGAALVTGVLAELPLDQSLALATLCAALSVTAAGGALGAPGWGDVADWWRHAAGDATLARYAFLDDVLPRDDERLRRRGERTLPFARHAAPLPAARGLADTAGSKKGKS